MSQINDHMRVWRRYQITHTTSYQYAASVLYARHRAHLLPDARPHQQVHRACLSVNQPLDESKESRDYFANRCQDFAINVPHQTLIVEANLDVSVCRLAILRHSPDWYGEGLARRSFDPKDQQGTAFALACAPFMGSSPMIPVLPQAVDWAMAHMSIGVPLHVGLLQLTQAMHAEFVFDPSATVVGASVAEVFERKRGVCQDFSHALIAALRGLGIPARYVSGYILTHPPPGEARLIGADATHAWVEAWCPDIGWIGLDPTNGQMVTDEFVTLACGRDYADVIPLRGVVVGGGEHTLTVSVSMLPYEKEQEPAAP